MRFISGIAGQWLGLCRKPPLVCASQLCISDLPGHAHEGLPDGRPGGSGTIRRGIGAAFSGMRVLNRNRQLLGFTLLAGLVMLGTTIGQGALCYLDWILSDEFLLRLVLRFFIGFATLFCLLVILAGLVLSIASGKEGHALFFTGLAGAKKYVRALFLWSFILALAGILLNRLFFYPGGLFWSFSPLLLNPLIQYPFTLTLNPSTFAEIPGYGGRSLLFWTYPYGFENALEFSAITLLLFIPTAFVVPLIVLEQKNLREAVAGSFGLMKKTGARLGACTLFLGVIVAGVFLTYLLLQAAHGMATPPDLLYDRPTSTWIALGLLYYLVLFSVAFVGATVGAIAVLDLYTSAERRLMTCSSGPDPRP